MGMPEDRTDSPFFLFEEGPFPGNLKVPAAGRFLERPAGRVLLGVALAWLPLVVLFAIRGMSRGMTGTSGLLLADPAIHARFLVALPAILLMPAFCRGRLAEVVRHFVRAGIVEGEDRARFAAEVSSVHRLRDSRIAAVALAAAAFAPSVAVIATAGRVLPSSLWGFAVEEGGAIAPAGWWLLAVSQPLYLFAFLRLLLRFGIWWRFLWRVSRLDLRLSAAHPDGAGGLAFLGGAIAPFSLGAFGIAAAAAGVVAKHVLSSGASVLEWKVPVVAFAGGLVLLIAGPLAFFAGPLARTKRRDVPRYSDLAGRVIARFDRRWLSGDPASAEGGVRPEDISAVADFGTTLAAVSRMRVFPFTWKTLIPVAVAALLPFLPVAAIQLPVRQLLGNIVKLIF